MKSMKLAVASLAAVCFAAPAMAADTWVGTANYGVETVGPFDAYDFSNAGVLLLEPGNTPTSANGYYQSFVTQHMLGQNVVSNPLLNATNGYEITVVANFASHLTSQTPQGNTYEVDGGSFQIWLDTTPDRNFNTDSGFANDTLLMQGVVLSGAGSNVSFFGQQIGGGSLTLQVTGYNLAVYDPDTIDGGDSVFSLRFNAPTDSSFLNGISSVQGHQYNAGTDLKYAADGYLVLTPVPEPESYGMLLAGLGLIGAIARRRVQR